MSEKPESQNLSTHIEPAEIEVINPVWLYFPTQLAALDKIRAETKGNSETISVNLLTITCLTSFLESIIGELLLELSNSVKFSSANKAHRRIIDNIEKGIYASTFQKTNDYLFLFTGKKLKDFTSDDTWECISHLFAFRNNLVHGRHFSYTTIYDSTNKKHFKFSSSYKDVYEYFFKKGIITKEVKEGEDYILKNEMIELFIEKSLLFFTDITKRISDENNIVTYDTMHYVREALSKRTK